MAQQLGVALWPGITPPGTTGQATMGSNWQIQTLHYLPTNVFFQSPDLEMLRIFDLLDRGFDPEGAAAWMNGNGYPTAAVWYPPPEKAVRHSGLRLLRFLARHALVRATSGMASLQSRNASWVQASRAVSADAGPTYASIGPASNPTIAIVVNRTQPA